MIYNTLHEITLACIKTFLHQGTIAKELGKFQELQHKNDNTKYNKQTLCRI